MIHGMLGSESSRASQLDSQTETSFDLRTRLAMPESMLDATHFSRVQKLAYSGVVICASAAYVHSVVRRCRPGRSRLFSALPIVICNIYLPTVFRNRSDIVVCVLVCLCQLWLCNLKVLALCFERGSLCEQYSPLQFLAVFALPVTPTKGENAGTHVPCYTQDTAFAQSLDLAAPPCLHACLCMHGFDFLSFQAYMHRHSTLVYAGCGDGPDTYIPMRLYAVQASKDPRGSS